MLDLFRSAAGESALHLKWTVGNAMSAMADDGLYDDMAELASDTAHGRSREMLVVALGRMKKRRAEAITLLRGLLPDEDVQGHALIALRKLKAKEAKEDILPFLNHPKTWVRNEAKKMLRSFGVVVPKGHEKRKSPSRASIREQESTRS